MREKFCVRLLILLTAALVVCLASPLAEGSTTGIVSGVVTDAATGAKLAGVNIAIKGTNLTTVTDANGYFVFTNVAPGRYAVVASLVGYGEAEIADLQVVMDVTAKADFQLKQAVTEEKEAEVKVTRPLVQPSVTPTLYMVTSKQEREVRSQPNYLYQIPGVVSTQPGIVVDPDGRPHIRGGRDNEIGYMLEGIPVIEPVSNIFATNTVTVGMDKLQVYTGGYRAEYGNAISGVLNEIKKTGKDYPGVSLDMVGGNQSYLGSYAEAGGGDPTKLDYYVGAYFWKSNFRQQTFSKAESQDTIGKFVMPKGDKDKFTLLINQGSAIYTLPTTHTITDLSKPVAEENDHGHQGYQLVGLTWAHNFTDSSFLTVRPYVLNSRATIDALGPTIGAFQQWYSHQRGLQFEYTNQLNEQHLFKAGLSGTQSGNFYRAYMPAWAGIDPSWGAYDYASKVDTFQIGAFAQDQIKINKRWNVDVGLRFDRMNFDCQTGPDLSPSQVSPRLGITYSPDKKNVLRFSWGKFIQFPMAYVLDREYVNPAWEEYRRTYNPLKPERATNWDIGIERQFGSTLLGRLTYFNRDYKDLIVTGRDLVAPSNPRIYYNGGSANSKGVELYLNKKVGKDLDGWLSYTYMKARGDASDFRYYPGAITYLDWDQRHTLVAALTRRSGKWTHSWMLDYGSGFADSLYGVDPSLQSRGKSHAIINYNVSYKLPKNSKVGDEMFLTVYNLFNTVRGVKRGLMPDPSDPSKAVAEEEGWIPPRFITMGVTRKF